jgi:hypothetical protein
VNELAIGRSTVFEVVRALRAAGALDELPEARYRLTNKTPLGRALRKLVDALAAAGETKVDRPPRPRLRTSRVASQIAGRNDSDS